MMKAKTIGSILTLTLILLSACLPNQSIPGKSPTTRFDISTATKVLSSQTPIMNITPSALLSESWTPSPDDLTSVASSGLTEFAAVLSETPAPYNDLLPLNSTPTGGWTTYTNVQYGFSFEYPSMYDTGPCGKLIVRESAQQFEIQFDGGTTSITITPAKNIDLKKYAQQLIDKDSYPPLTAVNDFMIDGVSAVRFGLRLGLPMSAQYQKLAIMIHEGKLYLFQYSFVNFVWCDAPPISEEAVYEHLIATWHFLP